MTPKTPETLGRYVIVAELGRGGFSVVYKALDTSLDNRPVALKVLHPHLLVDPTFVLRFQHEAGAAANLRHPNIVVVYEVGEIDGTYYIAMEYLPGASLDELIKEEGPLAPRRAVKIIKQIASALDYAHERGFIHRDVKSGNIIVGEDDHATLTDFGLVRAAEGTSLTSTGKIVGTPEYMSPEQADPIKTRELDWRTDLYSLGIVAYELLTGQVPFKGDTPTATHYMHVHEKPPKPTLMNPSLPKGMEGPVLTALAKERSDRYQTGEAFAESLAKSLVTQAPGARSKWLIAVGTASGFLVLALIFCAVIMLTRPGPTTIVSSPTCTAGAVIEPTPTRTHTPSALPTVTALPTKTTTIAPTSTALPTATPTGTASATPSPTAVIPVTPRPTTALPTATPTIVPPRVPDCPANLGCLTVVNRCGDTLTFSIAGETASEQEIVESGTKRTISLPAGQFGFTASTVYSIPIEGRPGHIWFWKPQEIDTHGNVALEAGKAYKLEFSVLCRRWEEGYCYDLELIVSGP